MAVELLSFNAHPLQVVHGNPVPVFGVYDEPTVGLTEHPVILRHPAGFLEALLEEAVPAMARTEQRSSGRRDFGGHALRNDQCSAPVTQLRFGMLPRSSIGDRSA
ncbi:hypothetical protein [Streptomyces lavendofoliae]|uniref:hypothetical protein n=1 Tax=Streptomyces lavendofoliae TaxID=67314 RepID=UPI0016761312|nr:hypothetical protein [Streptomyces lavendofoliae]